MPAMQESGDWSTVPARRLPAPGVAGQDGAAYRLLVSSKPPLKAAESPAPSPTDLPVPAALSPNVAGALWLVAASLAFATMGGLIKWLGGQGLHGFQIAFFRSLFGLLAISPILISKGGFKVFATPRWRLHLLRCVFGVSTMMMLFYAVTRMPLANVTAITFSQPLFMIPLAIVLLGETVGWRRGIATAVGFIGVLLLIAPDASGFQPVSLLALASAVCLATALTIVKILSTTDEPFTILAYFAVGAVLVSVGPAIAVWQMPSPGQWPFLMLIGLLASIGQYCAVRGFTDAEATVVAPFQYAQILFAGAIGLLFYDEVPTALKGIGALIMVAANVYILYRESRVKGPPPPDPRVEA